MQTINNILINMYENNLLSIGYSINHFKYKANPNT